MALHDKYAHQPDAMKLYTPKNCETVEFYFRGEKMAKTIGSLAAVKPVDQQIVSGILVGKDYQYHIMAEVELVEFTELRKSALYQRLCIPYYGSRELLEFHLRHMFGPLQSIGKNSLKVCMSCEEVHF
jgi:cleavage and polyadenylation specificity factor subunit 3